VLGIDDATRCPVVGSLICAGYVIDKKYLNKLKELGVKDSKLLTHNQIEILVITLKSIGEAISHRISPERISFSDKEYNLNDMECYTYCAIAEYFLSKYKISKIYINNFDRNRKKFIKRAKKLGFKFNYRKWVIEHNNESRDIVVGAASIIAKAESIKEFREAKELYGDFGSGNPNDRKTEEFIKKHLKHKKCNKGCNFIRWNWRTIERLRE